MKKYLTAIGALVIISALLCLPIWRSLNSPEAKDAKLATLHNDYQAVITGIDWAKGAKIQRGIIKLLPPDSIDLAPAYARLGVCLFNSERPEEAIKNIEHANSLDPLRPEVLESNIVLADAYNALEQKEKAREVLKHVKEKYDKINSKDRAVFMGMILGVEGRVENKNTPARK